MLQKLIHERQNEASSRPPRFYTNEPIRPLNERPIPLAQPSTSSAVSASAAAATYHIEGEEAKHMIKSLRLKEGDLVEMCDGRGNLVECLLSGVESSRGRWRACATEASSPRHEAWKGPSIVLAVACLTLKGGRSEWLVEKATEVGARYFLPLVTERSAAPTLSSKFKPAKGRKAGGDAGGLLSGNDEDLDDDKGRLDRVAIAATKQSLRSHVMNIDQPATIDQLVAMIKESDLALLAAAGAPPALDVLQNCDSKGKIAEEGETVAGKDPGLKMMLIVGPEGDFTPREVDLLMQAGAKPVGLGENRLRTETAAIALLSLAMLCP